MPKTRARGALLQAEGLQQKGVGLLKPAPKLLLFLGLSFPISKMEGWARGQEVSLCLQCFVALYCSSSSFVCYAFSPPAPPCSPLGLTGQFPPPAFFLPPCRASAPTPPPALLACTELTAGGRSRQGASRVSSQPLGKTVVVGAAVRGYSSVLVGAGSLGVICVQGN